MRKLLLGTSALIGATALVASASAAPELTTSGGLDFQLWGGENQARGFKRTRTADIDRGNSNSGWEFGNAHSLSELRFHAEAETDGGTSYGAHFDYRFLASATDEAYVFVSGDWGTVHLGQDDGAYDAHARSADSIAPGTYLVNGWATFMSPEKNATSDANKISYFSSDLNGFRFGVSVTADTDGITRNAAGVIISGANAARAVPDVANAGARNPHVANTAAQGAVIAGITNGAANYEDRYEYGMNYTFGYGGGSATISYGGVFASAQGNDEIAAGPLRTAAEREDLSEASLGFTASFGDVSIAGSLNSEGDSGLTKAEQNAGSEGRSYYDLGIAYSLGGDMTIGLSYAEATHSVGIANGTNGQADVTDERTQTLTAIDFAFPIMEGMNGFAGIAFSEYESDTASVKTAGLNNEATTYVIGTSVSF